MYSSACDTSTAGEVAIAWVPDVNDASSWYNHNSSTTIFNFPKWVSGPAYGGTAGFGKGSMSLSLSQSEVHNSLPWFYVGQSGEILNHFAGAIIIGLSSNGVGAKFIGRVFLEYDVEFIQPQSNQDLALLKEPSPPTSGGRYYPDPSLPVPSDPIDSSKSP